MTSRLRRSCIAFLLLISLPLSAAALDANGKWRLNSGEIVQLTQAGADLSFTAFGFSFSGGISPAGSFTNYFVSYHFDQPNPSVVASIEGRFMASGNLLDGRIVVVHIEPVQSAQVGSVVALRCTCDDGNSVGGDGCDAACQVEPCWSCTGDPSVCSPAADGSGCEDGRVCTSGETCSAGVCSGGAPLSPCVDMTGRWNVHDEIPVFGESSDRSADVVQRGSDLMLGDDYVGTIDPATGAFDVRRVTPFLNCTFDPLTGSIAPDGLTYAASGSVGAPTSNLPLCVMFDLTETGTRCGSGAIDLGEQCDDGNLNDGDGCSASCQIEQCWTCSGDPSACAPAGGGACDDANDCTTNDVCTGSLCGGTAAADGATCGSGIDPLACTRSSCTSGACVAAPLICEPCLACVVGTGCVSQPRSPCKGSTQPERSTLRLRNDADDTRDTILWMWNKGGATALGELGDPPAGDDYALCVYDETTVTPVLVFRAEVAGDGSCDGKPCWKPVGNRQFVYKSQAMPDGIGVMSLRSGSAGRARAVVKGKGVHLSDHPYPVPVVPLATLLRVQLHGSNGLCLQTKHAGGSVVKNDPATGFFKARGVP